MDWRRALYAYNHSSAYVDGVVRQAEAYRAAAVVKAPVCGLADGTICAVCECGII